jgi:hypothetical protein
MAKKSVKNHYDHHHRPPVTRREFLARGLMGFGASVVTPSVLGLASLASRQARADSCPPTGWTAGSIPFFVFDLPGGAALPGNFLVGKAGGPEDLLASYDSLGWNPRDAGALDRRFGLPMAANASKILTGIVQKASPAALANLRLASICHQGQSDSAGNNNSAILLVTRSGLYGSLFAAGLGTNNSFSGANTGVPAVDAAVKPLQVSSYNDLAGALSYGTAFSTGAGATISSSLLHSVLKAAAGMSAEQSAKLQSMNLGSQFANLFNCGMNRNIGLATPPAINMDPRQSAEMQAAFGITSSTQPNDYKVVMATIALNVLKGITGPGAMSCTMNGGFDYHGNDHVAADNVDLGAGQTIGMVIEAAHRLNQPFMFQIVTDGGIRAPSGSRDWNEDTNDSMTIVGYFNPSGVTPRSLLQIGNYTDGQGADGSTFVGSSTAKVAYAVFLNYLSVCGKMGQFRNFVAESDFPTPAAGLDSLLFFG